MLPPSKLIFSMYLFFSMKKSQQKCNQYLFRPVRGWGLCYKTLSYRNKFVLGFLTLNAFASTNSFSQLVQILSDPNVNRAQQIYQVSVSFINFYVICRPSKSWICNNSFTEQVPAHRDRALQAKNGLYVSLSLDWQSNCRRISRQLLLLLLLFLFLLLVQ